MARPWKSSSKNIPRTNLTTIGVTGTTPTFTAPSVPAVITFSPSQFFARAAILGAILHADSVLQSGLMSASTAMCGAIVEDSGIDFDVDNCVEELRDLDRQSVASKIGMAVTDLVLDTMGLHWRGHAEDLTGLPAPLGDFVYDGFPTSGSGVVLAEAKGSLSAAALPSGLRSTAESAFTRQVMPHLGEPTPVGQIIYGYAIAAGARPAMPSSAGFHLVEPSFSGVSLSSSLSAPSAALVRFSVAAATYRALFSLMGAENATAALDGISTSIVARPPQEFRRVTRGDYTFLVAINAPLNQFGASVGSFAIAESTLKMIANAYPDIAASSDPKVARLELRPAPSISLSSTADVVFPDGSAWLKAPDLTGDRVFWDPSQPVLRSA